MNHDTAGLHRRAVSLLRQGQTEAAIDAFRAYLDQCPDDADGWYNLGYLLRQRGQFEHALRAYERALEHGVRDPHEVHLNRAVILSDHLLRPGQAEAELQRALELAPDYAPALLNLGNLHEESGRAEEAIDCYQHLVETATPDESGLRLDALARLTHLQSPESVNDPLLVTVEQAAQRAPAGDPARANAWFALGRALDRLKAHRRAFAAFRAGNESARALAAPYRPERMEALVTALIEAFDSAPVTESAPESGVHDAPAPVFVCGMYRSGSTLAERVLAAHPEVAAGGELPLLPEMVAGPLAPFPASLRQCGRQRLDSLATQYLERMRSLVPEQATWITDKRPDNFLFVGLIQLLFPGARIVHTRRHPLDNGLSVFMQHLDARVAAYANRLEDIAHYYGQYRRLMSHWQQCFPQSIFDFDYDAFVHEPEPVLRELLGFLDLEYDPRCLQFHRSRQAVRTASYWQVRRPLYRSASGRWRHYREALEPLRRGLEAAGVVMPEPCRKPS